MKTSIFVDAFNLYYGCLKDTPYRWLNIAELCRVIVPDLDLEQASLKYYTARLKARPNNPDQLYRQRRYIRALRTLPRTEVVYGHFLTHPTTMKQEKPLHKPVRVIRAEEKGSDVNLAVDLLAGGFMELYERAIVISNDSDLARAIKIVKESLNIPVVVLNPHAKHPSKELRNIATEVRHIRNSALGKSQFPRILEDDRGKFHRPGQWG